MKNTGLILEAPRPRDWCFDGITGAERKVMMESNPDWSDFMPVGEMQRRDGVDLMHCVSESSENAIEGLLNFKGIPKDTANRSVRHLAIASGTTRAGNSYRNVAEAVISAGICKYSMFPFPDPVTWGEYYLEGRTLPENIIIDGLRWRDDWHPAWEWIAPTPNGTPVHELIRDALRYAPVVACDNYHSVVVVKDLGDRFKIFDSYDPYFKEWNYSRFLAAKIYMTDSPKEKIPLVEIANDTLVFETGKGRFGLKIGTRMYVDGLDKILAMWVMRTPDFKRKVTITGEQFDSFYHYNLKNEKI